MSSAVFETNPKHQVLIETELQKAPAMHSGYSLLAPIRFRMLSEDRIGFAEAELRST
jgi:hypothetical protein